MVSGDDGPAQLEHVDGTGGRTDICPDDWPIAEHVGVEPTSSINTGWFKPGAAPRQEPIDDDQGSDRDWVGSICRTWKYGPTSGTNTSLRGVGPGLAIQSIGP